MANLREIRGRIKGVKNTSKITQAMKMVAAAKLRRAQDAILSARPYSNAMRGLIKHLLSKIDRTLLPLMNEREETNAVLIVVITADRGLCGAFNSNIIKIATNRIHGEFADLHAEGKVELLCIGRRGLQHFSKRGYPIADSFIGLSDSPEFLNIRSIAQEITQAFLDGKYDRVEIVYNEFKSVVQQRQKAEPMLPIPSTEFDAAHDDLDDEPSHEYIDYIYEPSSIELLETLVPRHLNFQLWRCILESNAAEQGARMTAMDAATSNAKDLIQSLQLEYNQARQASITTEILEIVSGANALAES
ncbi:MAG: ATP synthase F1 subunit gamma [Ectothiorhodospiraceae bacterium]|nr:ATP synthase F1 subunit gamma [Ectothiorhodospiraceae bacterium]